MFVITGGGSGIGRFLAWALANRDKHVLIVGRRPDLLQETAAVSPRIHYRVTDLSSKAGLQSVAAYCQGLPLIEGLVNNAGTIEPVALVKDLQSDAWTHTLDTNLNAPLFLTQMLYSKLHNSRVLNIGSGAAYFPIKGWTAYCVTKAALSMLTRCWQNESETIAFASVMPGIVDTHMQVIARSDSSMDKERAQLYQKLKDKNRLIAPETVAAFLTWLLLDTDTKTFASKEWDIYETSHHKDWLRPPHQVLDWNV